MSVLNHVRRVMADPGGRLRTSVAAATAVGVLYAVGGCGVQPTGVHLTAGGPVTVETSSPSSPTTVAAAGKYPVYLFMLKGNFNSVVPVVRYADHDLSLNEIVNALGNALESEVTDGYHTEVGPGLGDQLKPTSQKHRYAIPSPLSNGAELQVVCTLDLYWVMNPDPDTTIRSTTQLVAPTITYSWDECNLPGFDTAMATLKEQSANSVLEGAAPVADAKLEPPATTAPAPAP